MTTIMMEKQIIIIFVQNHAQHEHSMASGEADGTKCLKILIRHHHVDV
jgi:hypothetical protein